MVGDLTRRSLPPYAGITVSSPFGHLSAEERALVADERALLDDLRASLERFGATEDDRTALANSIRQLDELFLLVVAGEFNAGKSAFLNALLATDVLAEGVTPTTARITVVRYGAAAGSRLDEHGILEVTVPAERLRDLHVVDTPGTNAVLREHEAVTTLFVPRADLVLFVTSADRPFTESERAFLTSIRDWGKKVVLVVNKVDILDTEAHVAEVVRFVDENARRLLNIEPVVFPVSAKLARRGRAGDAEAWGRSGFDTVERYLSETLDDVERVRLKLRNPLGVGHRIGTALQAEAAARLEVLREDREAVEEVERRVAMYSEDMHRDFSFRWADIEKLLVEMERRGHDHFDDTIRLTRFADLIDKTRVKELFEKTVIADTPERIERKVHELIDWIVDSDFQQWQQVHERLAERRAAHRERLGTMTPLPGGFHEQRGRLIESVGRRAQAVVETYDRTAEAKALAEKARGAAAASAAIEVGAIGLGATVAAVATTAAMDITGLALAGVMATIGFLVIPNRRREAKRELREKVTEIREQLGASLRSAFEDELQRGINRLRQGIEPYSRFVRAETEHLAAARAQIEALLIRVESIKARIAALGAPTN